MKPARDDAIVADAPARVNLLGEHTDYTGGLVLPMAIPFYTEARVSRSDDDRSRFRSKQFDGERTIHDTSRSERTGQWNDYPVGVLKELAKAGIQPRPFTLELNGNVPQGAGLSSSASVEVASCLALLIWCGQSLSGKEIALLCQRAENEFVGSPCGIMDQFVIANARAGNALLLDTRELTFEMVPMNTGNFRDVAVVICNSIVKHSIAAGSYRDRRTQVEEGQSVLRNVFPSVGDLGQATIEQLQHARGKMTHEAYSRCRHVITENARVRQAKKAMGEGDPGAMGKLMTESHVSQLDDFQCSCEEIDFLVDTAVELPGCFGARMTGGGFGGCTVNLVMRDQWESFSTMLMSKYLTRFGIAAEMYLCEAVDGALARNGYGAKTGKGMA